MLQTQSSRQHLSPTRPYSRSLYSQACPLTQDLRPFHDNPVFSTTLYSLACSLTRSSRPFHNHPVFSTSCALFSFIHFDICILISKLRTLLKIYRGWGVYRPIPPVLTAFQPVGLRDFCRLFLSLVPLLCTTSLWNQYDAASFSKYERVLEGGFGSNLFAQIRIRRRIGSLVLQCRGRYAQTPTL